jgi:hypothetical protein
MRAESAGVNTVGSSAIERPMIAFARYQFMGKWL